MFTGVIAENGRGGTWFAVLPDRPVSPAVATALSSAPRAVFHGSGRPWILGDWGHGEVRVGLARDVRVAVIGYSSTTGTELTRAAAQLRDRDLHGLSRLAGQLDGSFHLVAEAGGQSRIQGSVSGVRRVFHGVVDGVTVAADRADVVATLVGAAVDEEMLALRMLSPVVPHPFDGQPVWSGVVAVPDGSYLTVDRAGPSRTTVWWRPEDPTLSLAQGASALREELARAVRVRVRGEGTVAADLSGGLDSTSLCSLAAMLTRGTGRRLLTFTAGTGDPADQDPYWADLAAAQLGNVDRFTVEPGTLPLPYSGLSRSHPPLDEPFPNPEDRAIYLDIARRLRGQGARTHLTGFGGDEVLEGSVVCLHRLARSRPLLALSYARGLRALSRPPIRSILRLVGERGSYGRWLAGQAGVLLDGQPPPDALPASWGTPFRMPPWATGEAASTVRDRVLQTATTVQPLAASRDQHDALFSLHGSGYLMRLIETVTAEAGLRRSAPFLDDRVVRACLSVRTHERTTPWRYKPLIVEAMRGIVADPVLGRLNKTDGSALEYDGLRRHRRDLVALCEGSLLAERGLIHPDRLRSACVGPFPPSLLPAMLCSTLALERWLRDLAPRVTSRPTAVPGPTGPVTFEEERDL